jgi:uncharacterized membrane protein HdeD (DUF308 family)
MHNLTDLFAPGLERIRKSSNWFLALGFLLILLGVLCVGEAQFATTFSILALGWVLAISAVAWLINAFRAFSWNGFFLYLLNAIIRGVTGYILIRHPDAGAAGITLVLACLFIVGGLFRVAAAYTIQFPRWGWTVFSGVVSFILGLLLLFSWPVASIFFIGMAIGIDLIFDGSALVGFGAAIRSLPGLQTRAA